MFRLYGTTNNIEMYKFNYIYYINEEPILTNLKVLMDQQITAIAYNFNHTKFALGTLH